jgi:hypothetical protein
MAKPVAATGRLIAVDGSRGKDVTAAANAVAARLKRAGVECAVSRWDASGLFTELAAGGSSDGTVSLRSLSLLYAADLAFRLRWEIQPVLDAGGIVIAAGYVDTAVAFGASLGLSEDWLQKLLQFAPPPALCGLAQERKIDRPWKPRLDRGYPEYGAAILKAASLVPASKKTRRAMMARLEQGRRKKAFNLTATGIDGLASAATGSRPATPSGSRARSRTARK